MKDVIDEINSIHKRISEVRDKMNGFYQDIGIGNSPGKELRDSIAKDKIEELVKEHDMLVARLKDLVTE